MNVCKCECVCVSVYKYVYIHNKVSFLYLLFFTTVISMLISGIKQIGLFAYFEESLTGVFGDACVIQSC